MNKSKNVKNWVSICFRIGALSFGSSGRIILYRDALVDEKQWLTKQEFQEILTITSILPGPNLINLAAYIGYKLFGNRGAIMGITALCAPGAILSLLIIWFIPIHNPDIERIFHGFSIGAFSLYAVFISQLFSGLGHQSEKPQPFNIKFALRLLTAAGILCMSFVNLPFVLILVSGIILCLLVEFLT